MATNGYWGPPGGFDLDATKAREALTFDDIRDIAKKSVGSLNLTINSVANQQRRYAEYCVKQSTKRAQVPA